MSALLLTVAVAFGGPTEIGFCRSRYPEAALHLRTFRLQRRTEESPRGHTEHREKAQAAEPEVQLQPILQPEVYRSRRIIRSRGGC